MARIAAAANHAVEINATLVGTVAAVRADEDQWI